MLYLIRKVLDGQIFIAVFNTKGERDEIFDREKTLIAKDHQSGHTVESTPTLFVFNRGGINSQCIYVVALEIKPSSFYNVAD